MYLAVLYGSKRVLSKLMKCADVSLIRVGLLHDGINGFDLMLQSQPRTILLRYPRTAHKSANCKFPSYYKKSRIFDLGAINS